MLGATSFLRLVQRVLSIALLVMASTEELDLGTTSVEAKTKDLDTTLDLSPESFWKLAHSETFYRKTRMQEKNVNQKVVEVGKWVSKGGQNIMSSAAFVLPGQDKLAPSYPQRQLLQRTASLVNAVTCPLGVIETQVTQDQTLAAEGGVMTYVTVDSIKGVPLTKGDMVVKTTVNVESKADNPDCVRVRIKVNVAEIQLPTMLKWLKGRMSSSVQNDGIKQANKWLDQMVEAKDREDI